MLSTVVFAAIFLGRIEPVDRRLVVVALPIVAGSTLVALPANRPLQICGSAVLESGAQSRCVLTTMNRNPEEAQDDDGDS